MTIHFEKADHHHIEIIFHWLNEPHMQEFWDNSQEHKDDILNFIHGRKQHYIYGTAKYWIGYCDDVPFAFLLSDEMMRDQADFSETYKKYLSKSGHTIALDFGIGNVDLLGRGLAAPTLQAFIEFYCHEVDDLADTFFIDPDKNNARAIHVYQKAGFELVGEYIPTLGAFIDEPTLLMVRHF